ncbi:OB-fold domain-containing protein [Streptomyces sp. NPDC005373]|uniref:Zn-ribbon domain-containing OB-fold protein n=1 Tax=Streptomyces sp. NPDC005373 TaxID=3156879 RepID=UPI0033BACE2E
MNAPRPVPVPDALSAPYWEAAAGHILALARCGRCAAFAIPPDQTCPHCHATDPDFAYETVSGAGRVRSWTVVRQSPLPGLSEAVPFVLADVELDEQPELRMIGRLLDGLDAAWRVGDRVRVAFEDIAPGVCVPAFALDGAA